MKKGFTLIELLAVIVILAIIAIIAVPIILGIINDSKNQSSERSAEMYLKAAELAIARANIDGEVDITSCTVITNQTKANYAGSKAGDLYCGGKVVKVDIDGTIPTGGTIIFSNGKVSSVTGLIVSDKTYKTNSAGSLVIDDNGSNEELFTGTIYRVSTESLSIGDSIIPGMTTVYCGILGEEETSCDYGISWSSDAECVSGMENFGMSGIVCSPEIAPTGLTSYETDLSQLTQDYYLKHEVVNNIVISSQSCIRYIEDSVEKEACLDPNNSDTYDNMSSDTVYSVTGATGNIAVLSEVQGWFESNAGHCNYTAEESSCSNSSLYIMTMGQQGIGTGLSDFTMCYISGPSSSCRFST